jgi:hypothetical protein
MLNLCQKNYLGERSKASAAVTPVTVDFSAWLASLPKDPAISAPETVTTVAWAVSAGTGLTLTGQSLISPVAFAQLGAGTGGFGITGTVSVTATTSAGNTDVFWYKVNIE